MKVQEYPAIDSHWVLTLASKNEWFRSPGGCVLWWRVVANGPAFAIPYSRDSMYRMFAPADCSFWCNAASLAVEASGSRL